MTSKERVLAALERRPVDKAPIFMWFHHETSERLGRLLEIPASKVAEAFGDDVRQAWVGNNHEMGGVCHGRDGESHVDPFGIEWTREDGFNQISRYPLEDADEEKILNYRFPGQCLDGYMAHMRQPMEYKGEYFIGCDISPCVFELYCRLRGMENGIMDLAASPGLAAAFFRKCADYSCLLADESCRRFEIDWLWTGDDVGGQKAMIMSPETWRELIKPNLQRIFDVAKSHGKWLAYHSCGSIRPIIPDLIEMGLDVLNPVQGNCPGMEPLELKREFGRDLAFMGGVDTQNLLPNGSANDVRKATATLIEGMTADGGGYILAASHTVPPEAPDENIFAMYEAAGTSREHVFDNAANIRARMPGHG